MTHDELRDDVSMAGKIKGIVYDSEGFTGKVLVLGGTASDEEGVAELVSECVVPEAGRSLDVGY